MWSNPDWVVYSSDGRLPLGRGPSLSAALASAKSNEDWLRRQRAALEPWPWPGLPLVGGWPHGDVEEAHGTCRLSMGEVDETE